MKSQSFKNILKSSEQGWIMMLMAVLLPLAVIALSFVVDLGRDYKVKEKLRYAADGALVATGKVYLERPDLANFQTDDPLDNPEVKAMMEDYFKYNLTANGLEVEPNPGDPSSNPFSEGPIFGFSKSKDSSGKEDGGFNICIAAKYKVKNLYGSAFSLLPGGKSIEHSDVSVTSMYKIAPKTKIIMGIALDVSESVGSLRFGDLKSALVAAVEKLNNNSYILANNFNRHWDDDPARGILGHTIIPPTKIVSDKSGLNGVSEATRDELKALIASYTKPNTNDGTYMQGGIYKARKDMSSFIANNPNLENWQEYRRVIFILSDGWPNRRSEDVDNEDIDVQDLYDPPYSPPNYGISFDPRGSCGTALNSMALTAYEADQARKNGITIVTICSDGGCNKGHDPKNRTANMKRLANVKLNLIDRGSFYWQVNSGNSCFVPYLVNGDERFSDPNPFEPPPGIEEEHLFSVTTDEDLPERLQYIIGRFLPGGNQLTY